MKKIFFTITILFALAAKAQVNTSPKVLGDKAFKNKDYYEAAFYYKKAAMGMNLIKEQQMPYQGASKQAKKTGSATDQAYISFMLAESYRLYQNYLEAEPWYFKVLSENFESQYPLARLWYGVCLRANQRFDESEKQLQQFVSSYKGDAKNLDIAKKEIATCRFAREQYQYPVLVDVNTMKGSLSSDGSDYALIKREDNYFFTSSRKVKEEKTALNRIYQTKISDSKPQAIVFEDKEAGKNEVEYGAPSFESTGKRLYITRWFKSGSQTSYGIYKSEWQNGKWGELTKLNSNVNAQGFTSIQPFVSGDGKQLYFVSDKPGGQGGKDIWIADLNSSGEPVNSRNAGNIVNSEFDEEAPYFDATENKLVYSSKGFLGLGGYDLFESYNSNGKWTVPQNMGYPVNSAKDDMYYYPDNSDKNKFYLSSDRLSDCCLEIFEAFDKRHYLVGKVLDCVDQKPLSGASVSLKDSLAGTILKKITLPQNGRYQFNITTKRPYNVVVEKAGYFTKVVPVPTTGRMLKDTLFNADICLQPFEVNKPIVINNVLYDYDKATLRPESKTVLDGVVKILKDNPKIKIELAAHTDSIGSDIYNNKLSEARAQSCVDYVISRGISRDRIFARGYGKTKPIAPNSLPNGKDNPEGRQLNRRTEFTVLKTE
ncbi:OmpA family protein [Mucilaginibacter auburnensis]|uniref:WD40 repeat protein n=1 Tax=Mucilaginibacter auburnensis TaxID=1457233 RepID=A0A2H9VLK9_9SPHI|nr:OmpA family protein [Mucilaginibacter auburnensis]PJJ79203.1 WD40 repeat protein [Mucilaginibacter auburnensis]